MWRYLDEFSRNCIYPKRPCQRVMGFLSLQELQEVFHTWLGHPTIKGAIIILSDWTKGYLRPSADLIHGHEERIKDTVKAKLEVPIHSPHQFQSLGTTNSGFPSKSLFKILSYWSRVLKFLFILSILIVAYKWLPSFSLSAAQCSSDNRLENHHGTHVSHILALFVYLSISPQLR